MRAGALPTAVALSLSLAGPAAAQEWVALDRWLVSSPFAADSVGDPMASEYLSGAGEAGVLPDRGREAAGAEWTLARQDSVAEFDLDTIVAERPEAAVTYVHAYVRAPEDRTMLVEWAPLECSRISVWVNGRPARPGGSYDDGGASSEGDAPAQELMAVRLGLGWNTVLVKVASGDCRYGWRVRLGGPEPGAIEGIRTQASRPPGDVRTGPTPWVLAEGDAGPTRALTWQGEELMGMVRIPLTAWARTPIDSVDLKVRAGGEEARGAATWLTPGQADSALIALPFSRLVRATRESPAVRLELRWADEKVERELDLIPERLLEALHGPVELAGWREVREGAPGAEGAASGSGDVAPVPPLEAGVTLTGVWEVPGSLSGFTLALDVSESPGDYRINGLPVESIEGMVRLCGECERGASLALSVLTSGVWSMLPTAVVLDPGYLAARGNPSSPEVMEWLRHLDEKGNRRYRELGSRFGPAPHEGSGL